MPQILGMITEMRIHRGVVEEDDNRSLERIEAAVALNLCQQPCPIGAFQNPDIRYRPRKPEENPMMVSL